MDDKSNVQAQTSQGRGPSLDPNSSDRDAAIEASTKMFADFMNEKTNQREVDEICRVLGKPKEALAHETVEGVKQQVTDKQQEIELQRLQNIEKGKELEQKNEKTAEEPTARLGDLIPGLAQAIEGLANANVAVSEVGEARGNEAAPKTPLESMPEQQSYQSPLPNKHN